MVQFRVVLVGPKSEGNVGAVARVLRNFDVAELVLVDPPPLGDEAKERAIHAWDLVQGARRAASFTDAIRGSDYVVATSARIPPNPKAHVRNPVPVRDLPARLAPMEGTVALCFGREDFGLFNEELEHCDLLVTIPTSQRYKSLNLSHAVAVVLYELFAHEHPGPIKPLTPMSEEMRRTFHHAFDLLIDQLGLPAHKLKSTKQVYRKLFGRAVPSAWEYFVMMGVLSRTLRKYGIEIESGGWDPEFDVSPQFEQEFESLLDEAGRN